MGILRRIVSMTKAAANEVLDKIESPSIMMNHYLRDLDDQIAQAEHSVFEQQTQKRILQAKLDSFNAQIAFYQEKAEQAAAEGRERDARTALEAKLLYIEQYEETSKLQRLAEQAVVELEQRIEILKEERTQLQSKRNELVTRMQQVNGNKTYPAFAGNLHGSSATQGFSRIEQKIMEWEAQQEVAQSNHSFNQSANYTEQQQQARTAYVDEEMQRLMQKQDS